MWQYILIDVLHLSNDLDYIGIQGIIVN